MERPGHPSAPPAGLAAAVRVTVPRRLAAPARIAAALLGLGAGAGALAVAAGPGRFTTYAGSSQAGAALALCAGLGLIAAGLVMYLNRRPSRIGDLALLAGLTWFAPVWVAWQDGPPLVPSLAMVLGGFTFPLIFHVTLAYPAGRAGSGPARTLVAVVYAEALLTSVVLALARDPYLDRACLANCNVNIFLMRSLPSLVRAVGICDRWFAVTAATALVAICI